MNANLKFFRTPIITKFNAYTIGGMEELDKKEMVIRYGAIGFVLGILLTVTVNLMLLHALELSFSFRAIAAMHQQLWFLFVIDILFVPGFLIGIVMGRWWYRQLNILSTRVQQETAKNREIKSFTQDLIAGDLNTSFSFTHTDKTLSESLNKLKETLIRHRQICLPARNKTPGVYPDQELVLPDGNKLRKDFLVIRTDLKDELLFTLVIL
jgi:hypothetical protein